MEKLDLCASAEEQSITKNVEEHFASFENNLLATPVSNYHSEYNATNVSSIRKSYNEVQSDKQLLLPRKLYTNLLKNYNQVMH